MENRSIKNGHLQSTAASEFSDVLSSATTPDTKELLQVSETRSNFMNNDIDKNKDLNNSQFKLSDIIVLSKNSVANSEKIVFLRKFEETGEENSYMFDILHFYYKFFRNNICIVCGFRSRRVRKNDIRNHLIEHLEGKEFECDVCDKKYTSIDDLIEHKETIHAPFSDFSFPCDKCKRKFRTKTLLNLHISNKHIINYFTCEICNSKYKKKYYKTHLRSHTGEKPYECSECNKKFSTRKSMQIHSLQHSPENLFTCKVCDRKFNRKRYLAEHMNVHSSSSTGFACKYCKKTFNFRSNLNQHMLVHSDSRRHTCETCGKQFKLPHHLKNHISIHYES